MHCMYAMTCTATQGRGALLSRTRIQSHATTDICCDAGLAFRWAFRVGRGTPRRSEAVLCTIYTLEAFSRVPCVPFRTYDTSDMQKNGSIWILFRSVAVALSIHPFCSFFWLC
ncbi:hypothetical protein DAEQUDRAFT_318868 [Daedalea quercina L-15889]|uniref:Uncharacterized protein n=1 Tax=Daedalea quercina L-15889 TaxID=1314783 RepID=A0A165PXE7_9APHY|nr:hypothetical protein DAEQUDRAFT_318868 [Daedalea quercina L-15889]